MIDVRSRRAAATVATSAAVLLCVPVVAAGQVPSVDGVVEGVQGTAESLVPAPAAPAVPVPQVSAPAPAPAPKPQAAPAPAQAAPAPAAQAPAEQAQAAPAASGGKASAASASVSKGDRGRKASKGGVVAGASQNGASRKGADEAPAGTASASQAADAPEDANPATLPFTGLQLALLVMLGMGVLGAGVVLRRTGRQAG